MKYCFSVLVGLLVGLSGACGAITVNYLSFSFHPDVIDSGSAQLPSGHRVAIGYFDGGFDVSSNSGDYTTLLSAWNEVDFTTVAGGSGGGQDTAGHFGAAYNGGDSGTEQGEKLYLWVSKTSDASSDVSKTIEFGVFSDSSWVFPTDASPTDTFSTDQVSQVFGGTIVAGSPGSLQLTAVPEPEEYALVAGLALVCFAVFRRRTAKA